MTHQESNVNFEDLLKH